MERGDFMSLRKKILAIILFLVLSIGIAATAVVVIQNGATSQETFIAEIYTQKETIQVQAIALRSEVMIEGNVNGQADYHYENGVKVTKGASVASVYSSEEDVIKARKIEQLTAEKAMLEAASSQTSDVAYSSVLAQQAWKKISNFYTDLQKGNLSSVQQYKSQMTELFSGKNAATGKATDFSVRLAELQSEIDQLSASTAAPSSEILAPDAGYFVSSIDGYENFATLDKIRAMNASDLEDILTEKERSVSQANVAGKIISSYDWYLIALVPNDQLPVLQELADSSTLMGWNHRKEKLVNLSITFSSTQNIRGVLIDVKPRQGEDKTIVIFQCNDMNEELATLRKKEIGIIVNETEGLRVPRSAIRFNEEGEPGVFISIGGETKFRKLDVVSFDDNYVLSAIRDDVTSLRKYLQKDDLILLDTTGYNV